MQQLELDRQKVVNEDKSPGRGQIYFIINALLTMANKSELYQVCSQEEYSNSYRNYFALDQTSNTIVEVLVPIAFLCSVMNIVFFYKFPNARQPPFDILLLITILSFINQAVYIATVIYNYQNPIHVGAAVPDSFNSFCSVTGTLHFVVEIGVTIYNVVFCLYYTCKIKNPLKSWVRENKEVHGLCFVLIVLLTVVIYVSNQIGVSVLGICGLKVAKLSVFLELSIFFIYLFVLLVTSVFFLKYLSRLSRFDMKAKLFFKYYLLYAFLLSLVYLLQCVVMILLIVDCFTGITDKAYSAFAKAGNFLILVTPIISTVIIGFHPEFGNKFLPALFQKCRKKQDNSRASFYDSLLTTTSNRHTILPPSSISQPSSGSPTKMMIELTEFPQPKGYLSSIKQYNRLSLLSTILGCISLVHSRRKNNASLMNRSSIGSGQDDHIFSWNYSDRYEIQIDQETVDDEREFFVESVPAVMIKFISHATSVFQSLMDMDQRGDLENSTNPYKNLQKIYKNAQADGGSSGQFFFFTHDNLFLLKTITTRELHVLLQRLQSYYNYFKNNPESLIVKIYGVFTAVNPETKEELHFMMMGNLCQEINKKYVLRIYDCKGSSHKRQVFKEGKQEQEPHYSSKTMKDVDFTRLEHKVWIAKAQSDEIKRTLKADSQFFFENGLIDYSLIIIKVDYNAYALDTKSPTLNQRTMFRNEKEPNLIYILGIIDYLETWNVKKKGEQWYKSLWTRKETISSQSPIEYWRRFCDNLIQKIFN